MDYYPFGMPMPGKQIVGGELYRYAFQGQEKDPETGKEAFQLRLWDSRIGRWLTTDPAGQYSSPYIGMGNDPINGIDPDGAFELKWWAKIVNFVIGGDGVKFDELNNEYYVHKTSTIYEKETVSYGGDNYEVESRGVLFTRYYNSPEFYVEGGVNTSIGNQIGLSANLQNIIGLGGQIYSEKHQLYNRSLGYSNKRGIYGSNTPSTEEMNGWNAEFVIVNGGGTYNSKKGNFNWGEMKSESVGGSFVGGWASNYDYSHVLNANTIHSKNWGTSVHASAILGIELSYSFGYKY